MTRTTTRWILAAAALAVAGGVGFALLGGGSADAGAGGPSGAATASGGAAGDAGGDLPPVNVVKSPTCGCCTAWVRHLRESGFRVRTTDADDLTGTKRELGVPRDLWSCHTATVDGYVVEGHVPASDLRRLLEERPAVEGLAVPGMPVGSPGMEGDSPEAYEVVAFGGEAGRSVFARHEP